MLAIRRANCGTYHIVLTPHIRLVRDGRQFCHPLIGNAHIVMSSDRIALCV